jgi:hypothetical protein
LFGTAGDGRALVGFAGPARVELLFEPSITFNAFIPKRITTMPPKVSPSPFFHSIDDRIESSPVALA